MGEVLKERTERAKGDEELLSVTIANGVIRQIDSEKRNTASEDRSNYKIVKKGDVPYNSMRMWQGAVGNSKYNGIVSPAYTILTPTSEANGKFFMELFKKKSTLQIFQRWSQGLTSDTWNLKYPILSSIQFAIPSVEEQEKIAEYFSSLDHLITLHQRKYFIIYNKLITWEQRKLGEVFKEYSEKNHTELPALTIIQGGGTVKREESDRNLMYDESNLSNYKMVRKDDFIVHLRSFEGGLEKSLLDGIISPAYHTFHSDVADSRFYYPYFRSHEFIKHKLVPHVYGIRDGRSIDIAGMKTIEIPYTSIEEQRKIGDYLESLDHLITLHQRKCDDTKKLKKYMLQKMFPKNGEKFPKIRFKGFTEAWEQRKLGEVFKEYSEKNHTELPALTIIQGGGTVKREESDRNLMYDESNLSNYKMVRKDDFIVHLRSFEGGLEKSLLDGIISPAYHTFHSDVADSRFYYPYFRSHEFIKHKLVPHVYGIRDGRSIDIAGMKTIEIPYTSIEEQRKIGDYLESLDHLITLHQRKCDTLKELKKYMLQNMFPKKG